MPIFRRLESPFKMDNNFDWIIVVCGHCICVCINHSALSSLIQSTPPYVLNLASRLHAVDVSFKQSIECACVRPLTTISLTRTWHDFTPANHLKCYINSLLSHRNRNRKLRSDEMVESDMRDRRLISSLITTPKVLFSTLVLIFDWSY